ncbi:MAG: SEL1-like repeat protein [Dialister micraerophilus]|nr:SEL1-like repeat protein [Dialister micraerophilus]
MYYLGLCFARGAGVEKDKDAALFWLYKAYLGGEHEAIKSIQEYLGITIQ